MDLSDYLCQNEIDQLNQVFEISLRHDSALVFWTGISQQLAQDWARRNDLKTLTIAMGSLYAKGSQGRPKSRKSKKAWSKYMKGASWIFAQQACQNRYAIVLTNAPPNVYSTREDSSFREIEEPILKGIESDRHTIQIEYVHPKFSGAASFRYQTWPENRSSEWHSFLECITIKDMVKRFVQRAKLRRSEVIVELENMTPLHNSEHSVSLDTVYRDGQQESAQQVRAAGRAQVAGEQQTARAKKAAKQLKVEREQQAARAKKAAKQLKVEREQQAAQAKKAAKQLKVEREQQQAARAEKATKQLKVAKVLTCKVPGATFLPCLG
ncbi:hypothetical protein LTR78_003767 [Recurvomyces mirabilis]|uniref:Uncharacterized protein n=1 Tax=Recurvomyces mirabilis TaxID=574656 RepID=A0AAE0WR61_9PEZI|nr:hypothetical protein LTR78_003767 [Recurvomyces mirabilis]KAK5154879.1 hypothetical protein LTS14_006460 [Recurvomyces mirabilis]